MLTGGHVSGIELRRIFRAVIETQELAPGHVELAQLGE